MSRAAVFDQSDGRWVLGQAWSDRRSWEDKRGNGVSVSVNVSAHQFMTAGFADMVAAVLLSGESDPRLLTLEVTEGVFIRDTERALVVLTALTSVTSSRNGTLRYAAGTPAWRAASNATVAAVVRLSM